MENNALSEFVVISQFCDQSFIDTEMKVGMARHCQQL
jgi:hypothetical protein